MSSNLQSSKSFAIITSILIYAVAIILAVYTGSMFKHWHVLGQIAIADITGTIIIFFFSVLFNNSSMYDPYWSVKPVVIAIFFATQVPATEIWIPEITGLLLVALYALRLTANFYQGWPNIKHEDWRYRDFRKNFPNLYWLISFFGIHFFPTVMVYLGCLPLYVIFNQPVEYPILFSLGSIVLFFSVLLAYIADQQLRRFRLKPENDGNTIQTGLWKRSRHPNYLGEILTWWGLFLMALGCGLEYWWTGIGAVTITLMFKFISIPMIEKYALKRRWDYEEYQKQVPMLIPFLKP